MEIRLLRQNKGQIYFSAMLALLVLPLVLTASIYAINSNTKPFSMPIGRDTSGLLSASHNTQNALNYLSISAKYSAEQAAFDLGQKGGGSMCGHINGYSYWSRACFQDNYEDNFKLLFGSYLDDYLRNYPDLSFPLGNYEFITSGPKITGIAKNPVTAYIEGPKSNYIGYYSQKPSFSIDYGYDIKDIYDDLRFYVLQSEVEGSKSIANSAVECIKGDKKLLSACVAKAVSNIKRIRPQYDITYNQIFQNIFTFDISTKKGITAYSEEDRKSKNRDINVRFAIDFSHLDDTEPQQLGDPVEFIPVKIISQSLDEKCPTIVEDIPDYIFCSSEHYCKLFPEALRGIKDAQDAASQLGYKLNISAAYRTYEQQDDFFDEFQGELPVVDLPSCQAPHVTGKAVTVGFLGLDMGKEQLFDFSNPIRQKLRIVMETAGWVSHEGDYRRYECCGTELYLEKKLKGIDIKDITQIPFEFIPGTKEPGLGEKPSEESIVYLHDVWDIAKEENVNYYLVLAVMAQESNFLEKFINKKGDNLAHGVMQMFKPSTSDVYPQLKERYPGLKNLNPDYIQENIFTSAKREDVNVQIHAGVIYLKKVKSYLAEKDKPLDNPTIIQAYHDGAGYITSTGESTFCKTNNPKDCKESQEYYAKVSDHFEEFVALA